MKKRFGLLIGIALAFFGTCAVLLVTGIHCPIRFLTGIPCPGCGMTRACLGLLLGDSAPLSPPYDPSVCGEGAIGHIRYAMQFHPLVLIVPPALLYLVLGRRPLFGSAKREAAFIFGLCGLMIVVYAVRLALHDPVLAIDWDSGLIARMVHGLLSRPAK